MAIFTLGTDFTSALRQPGYANGRLLSATDLSTDQTTLRARDRWIGQAAGSGVVGGLTVTASATALSVAPGRGINRAGEPISLTSDATLPLAIPLAEVSPTNPAKFRCCEPGSHQDSQAVVGSGTYVLTVRPACRTEGSTATAPPPGTATSGGCVAAWTVAGVEFRVTTLPVGAKVSDIKVTEDNRRNLVAGWCYGVDQLADLPSDPFSFDQAYGLDGLTDLTDDDLPLATFSWSGQAIADLDSWSARRRIVEPQPDSGGWAVLTADRRIADGQARFSQFQDQVDELVSTQLASKVVSWETFPLLPPVGFLPVDDTDLKSITSRQLAVRDTSDESVKRVPWQTPREVTEGDLEMLTAAATATSGPGFNLRTFFGILAQFGGVIDWEIAEFLLRESWYRPPLVITEPEFVPEGPQRREAGVDIVDPGAVDGHDIEGGDLGSHDIEGGDLGGRDIEGGEPGGRDIVTRPAFGRPIMVYFVRQNVFALSRLSGQRKTRELRRARIQANRSNLYVVFVANYLWLGQSRPPLLSIGSFLEGPTPQIPGQQFPR